MTDIGDVAEAMRGSDVGAIGGGGYVLVVGVRVVRVLRLVGHAVPKRECDPVFICGLIHTVSSGDSGGGGGDRLEGFALTARET